MYARIAHALAQRGQGGGHRRKHRLLRARAVAWPAKSLMDPCCEHPTSPCAELWWQGRCSRHSWGLPVLLHSGAEGGEEQGASWQPPGPGLRQVVNWGLVDWMSVRWQARVHCLGVSLRWPACTSPSLCAVGWGWGELGHPGLRGAHLGVGVSPIHQ